MIIGVAVTELAAWGRRGNAAASRRAGFLSGIYATAEATVASHDPSAVTTQVSHQLTRLLSLESCRFQVGVAGLGASARLQHDGRVTVGDEAWPTDARGLSHDGQIELLVQTGGYLQGRFLMRPAEGARPPPAGNRLVAAALADQVGASLADHSVHRNGADQR